MFPVVFAVLLWYFSEKTEYERYERRDSIHAK